MRSRHKIIHLDTFRDGMVKVLVYAGAGVVAHQSKASKGSAVHHPDREGRTVHLLLGQLHIQELHILRKIWILVGILYHCTLQGKDRGGYEAIKRFM